MGLYPAGIKDNMDCILCTGCLKSCMRYNSSGSSENRPNPGISFIGFFSNPREHPPLTYAQTAFVFIASGFVMEEIISLYDLTNSVSSAFPTALIAAIGLQDKLSVRFMDGFVRFVCYPFVIWSLPLIALWAAKAKIKLGEYMRYYAAAFIPIMAAAHMSRAVIKMTSRFHYLTSAHHDPLGMETAALILSKKIVFDPMSHGTIMAVTAVMSVAVAGGVWLSVRIIGDLNLKLLDKNRAGTATYLIPVVYGGIFIVTLALWRWVGFN